MQMPTLKTLLFLSAIIILSLSVHTTDSPACAGGKVEPIGAFTNMRFTEEHAYGYTVELWRDGDRLFGFLMVSEGLAGDTPTGLLEDVNYDQATHRLAFRARLSMGLFYDKTHNGAPSQDVFRFKGILRKDEVTGSVEHTNMLTPEASPQREDVVLKHSAEQSGDMPVYENYEGWKRVADEILKRRGPK